MEVIDGDAARVSAQSLHSALNFPVEPHPVMWGVKSRGYSWHHPGHYGVIESCPREATARQPRILDPLETVHDAVLPSVMTLGVSATKGHAIKKVIAKPAVAPGHHAPRIARVESAQRRPNQGSTRARGVHQTNGPRAAARCLATRLVLVTGPAPLRDTHLAVGHHVLEPAGILLPGVLTAPACRFPHALVRPRRRMP